MLFHGRSLQRAAALPLSLIHIFRWVESEDLTDQAACQAAFADVDGIIVPGGFGDRGIEGMIQAAQYARCV